MGATAKVRCSICFLRVSSRGCWLISHTWRSTFSHFMHPTMCIPYPHIFPPSIPPYLHFRVFFFPCMFALTAWYLLTAWSSCCCASTKCSLLRAPLSFVRLFQSGTQSTAGWYIPLVCIWTFNSACISFVSAGWVGGHDGTIGDGVLLGIDSYDGNAFSTKCAAPIQARDCSRSLTMQGLCCLSVMLSMSTCNGTRTQTRYMGDQLQLCETRCEQPNFYDIFSSFHSFFWQARWTLIQCVHIQWCRLVSAFGKLFTNA